MLQNTANTDKLLLNKVAKGDQLAFKKLYFKWQGPLGHFVFSISKSKELTVEIIQDVFLKIWTSRETLAEIEDFKPYLFVMSRNHTLNALKKKLREEKKLQTWHSETHYIEFVEEDIDQTTLTILDEAIDNLSPRQKEIYLMHKHERLTYQQIGDALGIGKESVKTHLQLAVKAITQYVNRQMALIFLIILKIFIFC